MCQRLARSMWPITSVRSGGFSLLEMLLVVLLIASVSALAVASLGGGMDGWRLRAAVRDVGSELRHARARALASGQQQRFTITPAARAWHGINGRKGTVHERIGVTFTGARALQPDEGEGAIVFFADGASSGGRIDLAIRDSVWRIDVAWLTGEVRSFRVPAEQVPAEVAP